MTELVEDNTFLEREGWGWDWNSSVGSGILVQLCKSYCRLASRMRTGNAPVFHSVTKFVAAFEVDILLCIVNKRSLLYRYLMPSRGMDIRLLGSVTFALLSPCVHSTIKLSPNLSPRHPNIAFRRLNLLCSVLIYSSSCLPLTHLIFMDTIFLPLRYFTPFK